MGNLEKCCHNSVANVRFLLLRGNYVINLVSTSHRNMTDSRQQIASSSELFCHESALFLLTIIGKCTQHMYITAHTTGSNKVLLLLFLLMNACT